MSECQRVERWLSNYPVLILQGRSLTIVVVGFLLPITLVLDSIWWPIFHLFFITVVDCSLYLVLLLLPYCFTSPYSFSDLINLIDKSLLFFNCHYSDSLLFLFSSTTIFCSTLPQFLLFLLSYWLECSLDVVHHERLGLNVRIGIFQGSIIIWGVWIIKFSKLSCTILFINRRINHNSWSFIIFL